MQFRRDPPAAVLVRNQFRRRIQPADDGLWQTKLLRDYGERLFELVNPERPPLAYSLPGYHSGAYLDAPAELDALANLGFQWVTLHPVFRVRDGMVPQIDPTSAPDSRLALLAARERGMRVRLEPHLDFDSERYRWRRGMYVQPSGAYLNKVLFPLAELQPDEFTLGSELDVSLYEFPEEWMRVAERISAAGSALGHKLNHDALGAGLTPIRRELNAARVVRGRGRRSRFFFAQRVRPYLENLDYIAFSFYRPRPFPAAAQELERRLGGSFAIGEFGLGTADDSQPWLFDKPFTTPEDLAVRRSYYVDFLNWLASINGDRAACLWSTAQYDILGLFDERWRDVVLVEAVRAYHRGACQEGSYQAPP